MENITNTTQTICGNILETGCCQLLVCDHNSGEPVLVHTPNACCFSCGECVCVCHSGMMTMSIPPQVTAISVTKTSSCGC